MEQHTLHSMTRIFVAGACSLPLASHVLCCVVLCCVMLSAALGGPLPASITQLRDLEVLSLESNELSGTLPANMCKDMIGLRVRPGSLCLSLT